MGARKIHMCMSVRGALKMDRREFDRIHRNSCTDDQGRTMTPDQVRDYLMDELAKGHEVIPLGECDNFDYKTGCGGAPGRRKGRGSRLMASPHNHAPVEFTEFHLFAGIGGGSIGAAASRASWLGCTGSIRNIGAVDFDAAACADYERFTGSPISCLDLFDREQYVEFHGEQPPPEWREATPADILAAAGGESPDIVFTSPPCKGFSGLLPSASAASTKYQALNRLTLRSIDLTLRAFSKRLPAVILLENVPRIKSRGAHLIEQITDRLKRSGYVVSYADHDCGEIGGLGQRRRRFLLIARNPKRLRPFVYQPPVRPLRTIGDVIGPLPLPGDPSMGPMHRLPRLKWLTWLRLALIPAGGDWRDLQKIAPEEYRIQHEPRGGEPWGVQDWDTTGRTVTGSASVKGSNAVSVADFRLSNHGSNYAGSPGLMGVMEWDGTAPAVTGSASVSGSNCPAAIADPRLPESGGVFPGRFKVSAFETHAGTITGDTDVQCGAQSIADPRPASKAGRHHSHYRIVPWAEAAGTITGASHVGNGAPVVADHRLGCAPRSGSYGVDGWNDTLSTVIGSGDIHAARVAVADPRIPGNDERLDPPPVIIALDGTWHRPLTTLELAALQSFPLHFADGTPIKLHGNSDGKHRERIGNAVPPDASRAMHDQILLAMVQHHVGARYTLGTTPVWVVPNIRPRFRQTGNDPRNVSHTSEVPA
jgi:site-specific DNA-cytosine methylase